MAKPKEVRPAAPAENIYFVSYGDPPRAELPVIPFLEDYNAGNQFDVKSRPIAQSPKLVRLFKSEHR